MSNQIATQHTKQQIRSWLQRAVEKAKNPDRREQLKRLREKRAKKVAKTYGL